MGRLTRNKELLSAYKSPDANTGAKRIILDAMDNTHAYNQLIQIGQLVNQANASTSSTRMAGTALKDLGTDISPDSDRTKKDDLKRIIFGDKDYRAAAAEHKLRIANEMAGGNRSREELVDMLNQPGVQQHPSFRQALANDPDLAKLNELDANQGFIRPEFESPAFVGEGQFGRVTELAPGYVSKKQPPLIEFNGYEVNEDGSQSPFGRVLPPENNDGFFRIQDYRDVTNEVNQLNYLNKKGKGITPRVENLIIEPDGSTEVIMRDLRDNYDSSEDFLVDTATRFQDPNLSTEERTKAYKDHQLFQVKQKQQEARAALAGVELEDRHLGNIMRHKMTNRPLQIDPSGRSVEGLDRSAVVARSVVDGFNSAGLEQEAEIFNGLLTEAYQRGDTAAFTDLAQQGMSRLMKIKAI